MVTLCRRRRQNDRRPNRRARKARAVMMLGLEQFDAIRECGTENAAAPVVGALPAGLVLSEQAIGMFRAYLDARELKTYRIFSATYLGVSDISEYLAELDPQA